MDDNNSTIDEYLEKAKLFHNFVLENYPKGRYNNSERNILFLACCDLVLEHQGAIITLVQSARHLGSAFALLRPTLETCLRGYWILYCVEDLEISQLIAKKTKFPALQRCRDEVNTYFEEHAERRPFNMDSDYVNQLHGLTHTGLEQLQFRIDSELNIRPDYPSGAIVLLLKQASMWLAISAIAHLQMIEGTTNGRSNRFSGFFERLFGKEGGTEPTT